MDSMRLQSLLGSVLLALSGVSGLQTAAIAQVSPLLAQGTTAQCRDWQNNLVREWIERSRTHTQYQNPEAAAQALLRVVKVMGQSPTSQLRMETLRSLAEETPTGILQTFVELAIQQEKPEMALTVLPVLLEMAQSLPTAYSVVKTQSLTAIAKHYFALGEMAQAQDILRQATTAAGFLQGAEFQTKALTAIAQGYVRLGDTEQAQTLLDQSLQFAQQMNHPQPFRHAWVLEPIAQTYADIGNGEQALAVVQLLRQRDPSLQSYGNGAIATVIRNYAQQNQWDTVTDLLKRIDQPSAKAELLAELAGQQFKAGQTAQADKLRQQAIASAQQETSEGLQNNALIGVIRTYAKTTGQVSEALPLMKNLRDPASQATAFNELAALTKDQQQSITLISQGLTAARQITDQYQRSSLINQLIEQHFVAQRWAIALPIIQSLPDDDPSVDKYSWLSYVAREAAKTEDWAIALAATESLPSTWDDARNQGFQTVAVGYASEGNFTAALELVTRIGNSGSYPYQIRTLAAIADQARLQGDLSRSQTLLIQAQQAIQQLSFNDQKADALITLAIYQKKAGQLQQAQQHQTQALQLLQGDTTMIGYRLQEMIKQYLDAKDYSGAVQLVSAFPNIQDEQAWILNNLAEQLIAADALDTALAATNSIKIPEDKTRFLITLASYYLTDGNLTAVTATLDQALTTAKTIADPESRQLVFRAPPDQTIVDDPYDRASSLEAIALQYANIGQTTKAIEVATLIKDTTLRNALMQQLNCYGNLTR